MSNIPPPSPAPTLPTPAAPGMYPATPAADGAFGQHEGVLEQAGRNLDKGDSVDAETAKQDNNKAFGAGLLGAVAGGLVGGPIGALVGGGLASVGALEHAALKHKAEHDQGPTTSLPGTVAAPDATLSKQMSESPAQRELAAAGGAASAAPLSQLLSGGAGAHELEREVEEPAVTASLAETAVPSESVVDMSHPSLTPGLTPAEEKRDLHDGLSSNQKTALGAGAGLAAGGIGGAALASRSDDEVPTSTFDSPYRSTSSSAIPTAADPTTGSAFNEQLPPQSTISSGPPALAPPVGIAESRDVQQDDEQKKDGLSTGQKTALGAGAGLAAGGLGGAALASRNDDDRSSPLDSYSSPLASNSSASNIGNNQSGTSTGPAPPTTDTTHVAGDAAAGGLPIGVVAGTQTQHAPVPPNQPQTSSEAVDQSTGEPVLAQAGLNSIRPNEPALYAEQMGTSDGREGLEGGDRAGEAHAGGADGEHAEKGRDAAQVAAGAALGAAGAVGVGKALEQGGGSKDDASFPRGEDPKASLAAQLAGKNSIPADSRFYEGAALNKPGLQSRFSDATVDTMATIDANESNSAALGDVYDDQRAYAPVPHLQQRFVAGELSRDGDSDTPKSAVLSNSHSASGTDPVSGVATAVPSHQLEPVPAAVAIANVEGLRPDAQGSSASAYEDFAHLSTAPASGSTAAPASLGAGAGALDSTTGTAHPVTSQQQEAEHQHSRAPLAAAAGLGAAGLGAGGLAAAYKSEHPGQPQPGTQESARALDGPQGAAGVPLQHSDAHVQGQREGQGYASVAGAAAAGGATGLAGQQLYSQQHQQPQDLQQHDAEYQQHQQHSQPTHLGQGSPREHGEYDEGDYSDDENALDDEGRSRDHPHYNPIKKSPHMKIATRKDSIGHNRLHRKSLREPTAAVAGAGGIAGADVGRRPRKSSLSAGSVPIGHQDSTMQPREPVVGDTRAPLAAAAAVAGTGAGVGGASAYQQHQHHEQLGQHQQSGLAPPVGAQASHDPVIHHHDHARTEGEGIWNGAVSNVVHDETAHRGGQRPGLVTIESERPLELEQEHGRGQYAHTGDERLGESNDGRAFDRQAHDMTPAAAATHGQGHEQGYGHEQGSDLPVRRLEHHGPMTVAAPDSPSTAGASSPHRKLTRARRTSNSNDDKEKSGGFLSKLFGGSGRRGSKSSGSGSAPGSPSSASARRSEDLSRS